MLSTVLSVTLGCIVLALILSFVMKKRYAGSAYNTLFTILKWTLLGLGCAILIALAFASPFVATYFWVAPVLLLPCVVIVVIIFIKDSTNTSIGWDMLGAFCIFIVTMVTYGILYIGGFCVWTPSDDPAVIAAQQVEAKVIALQTDLANVKDGVTAVDGKMVDVKTDITGVQTSLDTVHQNMFALNAKTQTGINGVKADFTGLKADVEKLDTKTQAGFTAVNGKVADVKASVVGVDKSVMQLDTNTQTSIAGVQTAVTELKTGIATVQTNVAAVDEKVADVQAGVTGLKASVAGVQAGATEMKASVDNMNAGLTAVDEKVADVQAGVTGLKASVADVKTSVVALEKSVSMLLASQTGVRGEIASLTKKVTGLQLQSEKNAKAVANALNAFEAQLKSPSCSQEDVFEIKAALARISKALEKKNEMKVSNPVKKPATTTTSCHQVRWNGCNWYYVN